MAHLNCLSIFLVVLSLFSVAHSVATNINRSPPLDAKLMTDATQLDRLADLNSNASWIFDFFAQTGYSFSPGSVIYGNADSFPATIGNDLTMAIISLGPCAMLPPHIHRAGKYAVAIRGTTQTYMFEENGATMVVETLTPGKMTIFPAGSLHSMQNIGCTKSQLVTAFPSTDQGASTLINNLFTFPAHIVNAAFGNPLGGMMHYAEGVPPLWYGAAKGDPECIAKCKGKA